jgi:uncharacterized protein (DUF1499 family)
VPAFLRFVIRFVIGLGILFAGLTAIMAVLARIVKSPAQLGVRDGRLAPCPNSPNCVSTQSQDPRHRIDPIPYTGSPEEAKARLLRVIRSMDRTQIVADEPDYIHAEFRIVGIGYVDDVEFYIDPARQEIHFRSSARLPYWDWNVNRKRMEAIRAAFAAVEG